MNSNPQLELFFANAPYYENSLSLPYELLLKIFRNVIEISDHPLRDLWNLARVCETWRLIVIGSPSLWTRLTLSQIPVTDGNMNTLARIINQKPTFLSNILELSLYGRLQIKSNKSISFLEQLIEAPNLIELNIDDLETQIRAAALSRLVRSVSQCKSLRKLSIKNTKQFVGQQKWLADYLIDNGKHLEELHLTSSMSTISPQLIRAIASDFCPRLRVLDISTCDFINTRSFDAVQFAQNLPNLEILRVANVSFRRVHVAPEVPGLRRLRELSMPIGVRDADRDDALLATLAYGSDCIVTLDLRGSSVTANALENLPSYNLRELYIDDICPITRRLYQQFIRKWRHSLEVMSLVKINCSETIKSCLFALVYGDNDDPKKTSVIREVDLESSDVEPRDLSIFLRDAVTLQVINLSSCRSLPRGCKGRYVLNPSMKDGNLNDLRRRLDPDETDIDTEIDEQNHFLQTRPKRKKIRTRVTHQDYVCYFE